VAKLTIVFGFMLVVLGLIGYFGTGHAHPTALIPAGFGLLLMLCGKMGDTLEQKRHAMWMHIAVLIGLVGFLATAKALWQLVQLVRGMPFAYPAAVESKAAMAMLMLIFVLLCVRSFIVARRSRLA
jgi:hypothetical protein